MPKQSPSSLDSNYTAFLDGLKQRIRTAQVKAALAVNQELILLYWHIGREIIAKQKQASWGSKVIDHLARDLKREFPDIKGFSRSNLKAMRVFAEAYTEEQIGQQAVGQIPWSHNIRILEKVKDPQVRLWYVQQTIENGWSRNILERQIESGLFERTGGAVTNFKHVLPTPQSDLAQQLIKDPYNFDFLTLAKEAQERDLERGLVDHTRDFLLELGMGFSFLGSQYPLVVSGKEYRLDLLFYHAKLHCYVVLDLKMGEFEPQHSGQMSFYVAAVDNLLRSDQDAPTIGIILCKTKDKTTVENALQDQLPPDIQNRLPTVEQFEMELSTAIEAIEEDPNLGCEDSSQD